MAVELEISGCSIVLIGNFNPAIFHPAWFEQHKLITQQEAEQSALQVVHPDIAQMTVGTLSIVVEQQRFSVSTASAPWIAAADLIAKVFGEILVHTPITQAGINTQRHFRLPSAEARVAFGRRLAPPEMWGGFGERIEKATLPNTFNGVQIIAMREYWVDEPWTGWNQVKVEPSSQIGHGSGVYLEVNHHIQPIANSSGLAGTDLAVYIAKKFDAVVADGNDIAREVFKSVDGSKE